MLFITPYSVKFVTKNNVFFKELAALLIQITINQEQEDKLFISNLDNIKSSTTLQERTASINGFSIWIDLIRDAITIG